MHGVRRLLPSLLPRLLAACLAAAVGGAGSAPAGGTPSLRLLVYPVPGLFDVLDDGRIGGPGGALIAKISRASEVPFEVDNLPIARAWSTVLAQPDVCVLGMARTPEREARFQWVGIVSRADFVVYGRHDAPSAPADLDALRGKGVVSLRETATAHQLRERGVAVQEVSTAAGALRMLQAGRVDYWYSHQLVAESTARAAGGPAIKPLLTTARIDGYLACNLGAPAAAVDKLRQALQRLRHSGDLAEFGVR